MEDEDNRLVPPGALLAEQRLEAFAAAEIPEWVAEPDAPIDANDNASAWYCRTPAERSFQHFGQAVVVLAQLALILEGVRLDLGFGEAGEQVIAADQPQILRLDRVAVILKRLQQMRQLGAGRFTARAEQRRERRSRQPGRVEHPLLLGRACEPAQLADKIADGAGSGQFLVTGHMGADISPKP